MFQICDENAQQKHDINVIQERQTYKKGFLENWATQVSEKKKRS